MEIPFVTWLITFFALFNVVFATAPHIFKPRLNEGIGGEAPTTNAERLAMGFPLLRPKSLYDPTRSSVLKPRKSPTPQCQLAPGPQGRIAVYNGTSFYGWLKDGSSDLYIDGSTKSSSNLFSYNNNGNFVQFSWCSSKDVGTTTQNRLLSFIRSSDVTLAYGNTYYVNLFFSYTSVPEYTRSAFDGTYYVQNDLFTIDSDNWITATWTNPDGSTIPALYYASDDQLWGTAALNAKTFQFYLKWVPI